MIQKGRFFSLPHMRDKTEQFGRYVLHCFEDPETKFVRAQQTWNDLIPLNEDAIRTIDAWDRAVAFEDIPRPKPPYRHIWLEAQVADKGDPVPSQKVGVIVRRCDVPPGEDLERWLEKDKHGKLHDSVKQQILRDHPATIVNCVFSYDCEGAAALACTSLYWLDSDGKFLSSGRIAAFSEEPTTDLRMRTYAAMRLRQGWVMHTMARMNCANVKLVPVREGAVKHHHRNDPPSSVWHEIQVADAPKMRRTAPALPSDNEGHKVRFHWIRGHYADYTQGKGLFGNPNLRKLFWIPEHTAGDEELGTVAASYNVH
jgi:hypothetical protein